MPYFYTDPARESETYAVPDAEAVYLHPGPRRTYDRLYVMDVLHECEAPATGCEDCPEPGWYWRPCFPGCLPDGEFTGPYPTEDAAIEAAREDCAE